MKYCGECGQALPNQAKFCRKCGKPQSNYNITITDEKLEDAINVNVDTNITSNTSQQQETSISNGYDTEVALTRCPYCLETIIKGARICRFCNTDLNSGKIRVSVSKKYTDSSTNWSIFMSIAFLVMQIAATVLALTDLLNINIVLGYDVYNFFEGSIGISIFTCFDISDVLESIQEITHSFAADNLIVGLKIIGIILFALFSLYVMSLIYRFYELYQDYRWCVKECTRYSFCGYSIIIPILFVIVIVLVCHFINVYLSDVEITSIKMGLSPTMISFIVLLVIQGVLNVLAEIYDDAVEDKAPK